MADQGDDWWFGSAVNNLGPHILEQLREKYDINEDEVHPLEVIFMVVPMEFALQDHDYSRLVCTKKSMSESLKFVDKYETLDLECNVRVNTEDDGLIVLEEALPTKACVDDIKLVFNENKNAFPNGFDHHAHKALTRYVPTKFPALPYARKFQVSYSAPCCTVQDVDFFPALELDMLSLPNTLIGIEISLESTWRPPLNAKICSEPRENFAHLFPGLQWLHLHRVSFQHGTLQLPPALRYLTLDGVVGLHEIAFQSAPMEHGYFWADGMELDPEPNVEHFPSKIKELHWIGIHNGPTNIPETVRELTITTSYFLKCSIPSGIEILTVSDCYFDENRHGINGNFGIDDGFAEKWNSYEFNELTHVRLEQTDFSCLVLPPNVLVLSHSAQGDIILPSAAEEIHLFNLPAIENLVVPPSCRFLKLEAMILLKEIVFSGCSITALSFSRLPNLEIVRAENGAVIPSDIPVHLDDENYTYTYGEMCEFDFDKDWDAADRKAKVKARRFCGF